MKSAKIIVSEDEMNLVLNKEWLYLKRSVTGKAFDFLGMLHQSYNGIAQEHSGQLGYLPINRMGKISRGENLEGLPYLILDYPALFSKEKIMAVRTLFWWGHFFCISLHLGGLNVTEAQTIPWIEFFKKHEFFINNSGNEWNYEFGSNGFQTFVAQNKMYATAISKNGIFRVAQKCALNDWHAAENKLLHAFKIIIAYLSANFPGGERGLLPGFPKAGLHL